MSLYIEWRQLTVWRDSKAKFGNSHNFCVSTVEIPHTADWQACMLYVYDVVNWADSYSCICRYQSTDCSVLQLHLTSSAKLFQLPSLRSGTHCLTMSSQHHPSSRVPAPCEQFSLLLQSLCCWHFWVFLWAFSVVVVTKATLKSYWLIDYCSIIIIIIKLN